MLDLGDVGVLELGVVTVSCGVWYTAVCWLEISLSMHVELLSIEKWPLKLAIISYRIVFYYQTRLFNYFLYFVICIEVVYLSHHLRQNRFTVSDEQIQQAFIFFNIVTCSPIANQVFLC